MPRAPRLELSDGLFHVTVRGVAETSICRLDADYDRFVRLLAPISKRTRPALTSPTASRPPNGRYAKPFNHDRGRRGHLFAARYYAKPIATTNRR
jgi:hypothetical protein